jgi:hypothetical protein
VAAEDGGSQRNEESKAQVVKEHVVILAPPKERMACVLCEELRNGTQAIKVGNNTSEGNKRALAPIQRNNVRNAPTYK